MAEPSFLSGGDTPHRQDTVWKAAVRWLGRVQNNVASPFAANNPKLTDSLHRILQKTAAALAGVGCISCASFPVATDSRITEDGDTRVTDTGNTRIVD